MIKEEHHHHHHYPKYPYWTSHTGYSSGGSGIVGSGCSAWNNGGETKYSSSSMKGSSVKGSSLGSMLRTANLKCQSQNEDFSKSISPLNSNVELKDGCTVEGGHTGQYFSTVSIDLEDTCTTLRVFLQGYDADQMVEVPVSQKKTVKNILIDQLSKENEELRLKIVELENEKLKVELEQKSKPKPKKPRKKVK